MRKLYTWVFEKILGWKLIGNFPVLDKYIIIVVPHTSWHDFYMGVLIRGMAKDTMHYVAKKELFKFPFGWYFKWMGGAPIDRSKNTNTVEAIIRIFNERKEFRLALSPEGTRKKVARFKTGFYYIAKGANIPIIMLALDYKNKEVRLSEPFYPTQNTENDFHFMHSHFSGVMGRITENSFIKE